MGRNDADGDGCVQGVVRNCAEVVVGVRLARLGFCVSATMRKRSFGEGHKQQGMATWTHEGVTCDMLKRQRGASTVTATEQITWKSSLKRALAAFAVTAARGAGRTHCSPRWWEISPSGATPMPPPQPAWMRAFHQAVTPCPSHLWLVDQGRDSLAGLARLGERCRTLERVGQERRRSA